MLKRPEFSRAWRLTGASALAVLTAGAAFAAQPERTVPVLAPASTPLTSIQVARLSSLPAGPREAPRVVLAQATPASAPAQASPASAPSGAPAAVQYDNNMPSLIRGTLLGVNSSGTHPMATVQTEACVSCGTPARTFQVEITRLESGTPGAQADVRVGETVTTRGYWEKGADPINCANNCRITGRDMTYADGAGVFKDPNTAVPTCGPVDGRQVCSPGARASGQSPDGASQPGGIIGLSPFTNAVERAKP